MWKPLVCGTSVVKYTSEPPRVACAYLVGFRPSRLRKFLCAYFKHRVSCSFLFSCRIRSRLLPKPPDSELLNSPDTSSSTMECSFGITGTYQSFSFKVRNSPSLWYQSLPTSRCRTSCPPLPFAICPSSLPLECSCTFGFMPPPHHDRFSLLSLHTPLPPSRPPPPPLGAP